VLIVLGLNLMKVKLPPRERPSTATSKLILDDADEKDLRRFF